MRSPDRLGLIAEKDIALGSRSAWRRADTTRCASCGWSSAIRRVSTGLCRHFSVLLHRCLWGWLRPLWCALGVCHSCHREQANGARRQYQS
jgi:hypothetical protein